MLRNEIHSNSDLTDYFYKILKRVNSHWCLFTIKQLLHYHRTTENNISVGQEQNCSCSVCVAAVRWKTHIWKVEESFFLNYSHKYKMSTWYQSDFIQPLYTWQVGSFTSERCRTLQTICCPTSILFKNVFSTMKMCFIVSVGHDYRNRGRPCLQIIFNAIISQVLLLL